MSRGELFLLLFLAGITGVAGIGSTAVEGRAYLGYGEAPSGLIKAISDHELAPGLSTFSRQTALDGCVTAMQSIEGRLLPGGEKTGLAQACEKMAEAVTSLAPTSSYAVFVRALAASRLGNYAAVSDGLTRSEQLAPDEEWLALQRVALAEQVRDHLDPSAIEAERRDLAKLLKSRRGIAALASRFISDPGFRKRFSDLLMALPSADARKFLNGVQALSGQAG